MYNEVKNTWNIFKPDALYVFFDCKSWILKHGSQWVIAPNL